MSFRSSGAPGTREHAGDHLARHANAPSRRRGAVDRHTYPEIESLRRVTVEPTSGIDLRSFYPDERWVQGLVDRVRQSITLASSPWGRAAAVGSIFSRIGPTRARSSVTRWRDTMIVASRAALVCRHIGRTRLSHPCSVPPSESRQRRLPRSTPAAVGARGSRRAIMFDPGALVGLNAPSYQVGHVQGT